MAFIKGEGPRIDWGEHQVVEQKSMGEVMSTSSCMVKEKTTALP